MGVLQTDGEIAGGDWHSHPTPDTYKDMNQTNKEQLAQRAREREAEDAGCSGLLPRAARNLKTGELWSASTATKADGPFYCPACYSDAVIRKCSEKVDHFAHAARLSPAVGAREMHLHNQCTAEIAAALAVADPGGNWTVQRVMRDNEGKGRPTLVPDISGRINKKPFVVEVQISAYTLPKIMERTKAYAQWGAPIVWIVPLTGPLGTLPFRPRLYERYLHSIYFGRVYYWWPGLGAVVKPVHFANTSRWIPHSEWFEEGEERSAGGFPKRYKTVKAPQYGPDVHLGTDFVKEFRQTFTPENERKEVPACYVWRDSHSPWWSPSDKDIDVTPPEPTWE
jgi:competence protein CoiA